MAIDITHVWTDRNVIVYLLETSGSPLGGEAVIPAAGGATPDLVTDGANGSFESPVAAALRRVIRAGLDGLGTVAAGAFTQDDARNLYFADGSVAIGGPLTPRALVRLVPRTGAGDWRIDADADHNGVPELVIGADVAAATAVLYVELAHSLAV